MSNATIILPVLVFGVILLLGVAISISRHRPRLQQRLEAMSARGSTLTMRERLERPFVDRTVLPMLDQIARKVTRWMPRERADKLQRELVKAGLYPRVTTTRFVGASCVCAVLFLLFVPAGFSLTNLSANAAGVETPRLIDQLLDPQSLVMCLGVGLLGYFVPRAELGRRVRLRQQAILRALPTSVDLIAIAIEASMGFDQAMSYVRKRTRGPLSDEFGTTLNEMRLGKSRIEALRHLASRLDIEDVAVFVGAVIESLQIGSSLAQTLRIQADSTRILQRQRVQEEVMKVPVKILFPLVLFVFPALLVVILGPATINIFSQY